MTQRLVIDKESEKYQAARRECLRNIYDAIHWEKDVFANMKVALDKFIDDVLTIEHTSEENPWRKFS